MKGKRVVKSPGGTAFYSTHAYHLLGLKTAVLTSFNTNDVFSLTPGFKNKKISILTMKMPPQQNLGTTIQKID